MGCSGFDVGAYAINSFTHIIVVDGPLDRTFDSLRVSSNGGTMFVKHRIFMVERRNVSTDKVPDTGVFGNDTQGQLLATATNHEGWVRFLDRFGFATSIFEMIIFAIKVGDGLRP